MNERFKARSPMSNWLNGDRPPKDQSRRGLYGHRLNFSAREVITAVDESTGKTLDQQLIDLYMGDIEKHGVDNCVIYLKGTSAHMVIDLLPDDIEIQLEGICALLNIGRCLSLEIKTKDEIEDMVSKGMVIAKGSPELILEYTKLCGNLCGGMGYSDIESLCDGYLHAIREV